MRSYELVILERPTMEKEEREGLVEKFSNIIEDNGGELNKQDDWGRKKLAYEIKNETEAYYNLFDFQGNNKVLDELKRNIKLSEVIIRDLLVRKK